MKKLIAFLSIPILILSCTSDDGDQVVPQSDKLLRTISFSGSSSYSLTFFYNLDKTIDRIQSSGTGDDFIKQFFYQNGNIDRAEFQDINGVSNGTVERFIYENGELVGREDYFNNTTLDEKYEYEFSNGVVGEIRYFGFNETSFSRRILLEYNANQNLTAQTINNVNNSNSDVVVTYSYDDKKNPLNNFEPNIVLIDDFKSFQNNITSEVSRNPSNNNNVSTSNFAYTYDSDGYATSRTDGSETMTYSYY
ncbi:hypothetical protein SAMN05192588_2136 [Nonlabens sp. Hel1_33_55]|uniref:hypothetical protein n=1 Tax=Nonlabens sp. Hel1_33_55 TaxID=1336802 RepID=UPI000875CD72|nr:hypothetical protein [Nonlabens sp. Hel1_33_55]SCY30084.1 hypothetical protein SAMN05192588_2136 [Nonlabens sp. Hel1_33_55]